MKRFIDYIHKLSFKSVPDYKYLTNLIHRAALNNHVVVNSPIDWVQRTNKTNVSKSTDGIFDRSSISNGDI